MIMERTRQEISLTVLAHLSCWLSTRRNTLELDFSVLCCHHVIDA